MKTTLDLPDELLERATFAAAERGTTLGGLEIVLGKDWTHSLPADPLARLGRGYDLGGVPLSRDQAHLR